VAELLKNKLGLKVLTDTGFSDFDGLLIKSVRNLLCITLSKTEIKCTDDHKIFLSDLTHKEAKYLKAGDNVYTSYGIDKVLEISNVPEEQTYDLFNVKKNHRFYANNILVKNCEFLIFDETLINSVSLAEMSGIDPIERLGQVRFYKKLRPNTTYMIALDPSAGTGGNNAAIQVFDIPKFEQIAEWNHNGTPISQQIRILKDICTFIKENTNSIIYWSVENNSIGEACLTTIKDIGEENIPGFFLSEPIRKGHVRRFRKGFNTTHKSKMTASLKLKSLVEQKRMQIYSKPLISELKTFVASGTSFKAKLGESDDLVSACLLICRMARVLADWDPLVFEKLSDRSEDEILPMPIFVSSYIA
jgi:hypothetical protein